jgi:hypothetical protein
MERHKKGKSRFLVVTVGGQPGYAVLQLDGLFRDYSVTPVYKGVRTRHQAEQVARRLSRQVPGTNRLSRQVVSRQVVSGTKFHIPLKTKQEQMRRRAAGSASLAGATRLRPYTIDELVELHGRSRRTVIRLYENEPGIETVVSPEKMHSRQHRSIRVPHYIYERVRQRLGGA